MQSRSPRMMPWFAPCGIVVLALGALAGVISFRNVAFAAQTPAPSSLGAAVSASPVCPFSGPLPFPLSPREARLRCVYRIAAGDTLSTIARHFATTPETLSRLNRKRLVSGQKPITNRNALTAGALLLIPPPLASPAPAPATPHASSQPTEAHESPVPTPVEEKIVKTREALQEAQTSLTAALGEQTTRLVELIELARQYGQQLVHIGDNLAELTHMLEQQRIALAALQNDVEKTQSRWAPGNAVLLVVGGLYTLVTIVALLGAAALSHSPHAPSVETTASSLAPVAAPTMSPRNPFPMDIRIAACSLSSPKGEDVVLSAEEAHFSAIVVADGASSALCGGAELSGGGAQAAQIAAKTAITYLKNNLLPAMGIKEMLSLLEDCFSTARTALEHTNASAPTPGATTLLIGMLCQTPDGRWYWLFGHVGNGVLALLHTEQRLSSWPVATPLLSKHANGRTTITLPGYETQGVLPSVGVRLHRPGDLFVIASDGLDHLDTVTKHADRLTFLNYLWKIVQDERSGLERGLKALVTGRDDKEWQNALALDDTTIGILWA